MKVLHFIRGSSRQYPGGDNLRLEQTRRELGQLGVKTAVTSDTGASLTGYDLVHVWNAPDQDSHGFVQHARTHGVPIAVSTIFDDATLLGFAESRSPALETARRFFGYRVGGALHAARVRRRERRTPSWQRTKAVLDAADRLLPVSNWETRVLRSRFDATTPATTVPVGVDAKQFAGGDATRFHKRFPAGRFALCVGRIEFRKNQHSLIPALAGQKLSLVCVGQPGKSGEAYRRECEELARKYQIPLTITGQLSPAGVADALAACSVHVLPSWIETMGQAALQAAAAGRPMVVTTESPWREYFGANAVTCRPFSPRSIRRGIRIALTRPPAVRRTLQRAIAKKFTWQRAGEITRDAYQAILKEES